MTEAEKLILSEIRETRREFSSKLKDFREDINKIHDRIDKTNENVHVIDKATSTNKTKLGLIMGGVSFIFSTIGAAFFAWVKSADIVK